MNSWFIFVAASIAIIVVPGPTVSVIIANSLKSGMYAGWLNIAGTQLGLLLMMLILAFGFGHISESSQNIFNIIRWVGALYLIYLGQRLWFSKGYLGSSNAKETARRSNWFYFWQGFLVICSNPKALFFFGAFIPQFVDNSGNTTVQVLFFGVTFMLVGAIFDGAYAVAAGKAGSLINERNVRVLELVSGSCLTGGGLWLLVSRV